MPRVTSIATALAAAVLAVAGCASESEPASTATGSEETLKVGLAYDIGGRGDQSFNDSAAAGLDRAKAEYGVETNESVASEGEPESAKEERLRLLAQNGFDPIIAVGFAYGPSLAQVAPEFPDVRFAIVDDASVMEDNVANLIFAEEEGSFLVGAAAALKSQSGQLGFIGGCTVPLIGKFEAGYAAGAKHINPDAEVDVRYLSDPPACPGFSDPAAGNTAATGMYESGADIVYHAAGGSGSGLFEAADAAGGLAIGVDSDQYLTADEAVRDAILTSMLKRVDVAVFDFITSVRDGDFTAGEVVYDLEAGGVGYSTSGGQVDDITDQLDEIAQKIIDGEIKVPTEP